MTYGENSAAIRRELGHLVDQHRVQQRLGGPGSHTVPQSTTAAQRREMGRVVRRYRHAILVWCHQGLRAVSTKNDPLLRRKQHRTDWEDLDAQVLFNTPPPSDDLPLLPLLASEHTFDLLATWQGAARAAALGEHDFVAGVNRGGLSASQMRTVAADVAEVVGALTVLDARYRNIPGWQGLPRRTKLAAAAQRVSEIAAEQATDRSVDRRGWRPQVVLLTAPFRPGLVGAAEAQRALIDELGHQLTALNLRRVFLLQAQASSALVTRIGTQCPDLSAGMTDRADVYRQLVSQSRNLSGLLGGGAGAVIAAERVVAALEGTAEMSPGELTTMQQLRRLFTTTDAQMTTLIERGLAQRVYFIAAPIPRGVDASVVATPSRRRYLPVTPATEDPFVLAVRGRLNPGTVTHIVHPLPADRVAARDHRTGQVQRPADRRAPGL